MKGKSGRSRKQMVAIIMRMKQMAGGSGMGMHGHGDFTRPGHRMTMDVKKGDIRWSKDKMGGSKRRKVQYTGDGKTKVLSKWEKVPPGKPIGKAPLTKKQLIASIGKKKRGYEGDPRVVEGLKKLDKEIGKVVRGEGGFEPVKKYPMTKQGMIDSLLHRSKTREGRLERLRRLKKRGLDLLKKKKRRFPIGRDRIGI